MSVFRERDRNPIKLCLSSKAPKMIGVHIYRGECSVILCDFQLHILQRRSFPVTEENHGQLLEHLFHRIDEILDRIPRTEICGIGIGALGPVDVGKGRILNPPNFYGMKNIDIVSVLKARYEMPVFFDSQYDGAALAEKFFGNGRDVEDFVFVGLANGIGSGIISQGNIYRDYSGFTSELGHVSIDWNGRECSCGRKGCLETYVSQSGDSQTAMPDYRMEEKLSGVLPDRYVRVCKRNRPGAGRYDGKTGLWDCESDKFV